PKVLPLKRPCRQICCPIPCLPPLMSMGGFLFLNPPNPIPWVLTLCCISRLIIFVSCWILTETGGLIAVPFLLTAFPCPWAVRFIKEVCIQRLHPTCLS